MKTVVDSKNRKIVLEKDIAGGGEARIWTVKGQTNVVAKFYHQPTAEHEAKVAAMICSPPVQPSTHTAIAWPLEMIYDQRRFAGFLMPHIQQSALIFQFYNPAQRKKMPNFFTWEHMHRVAYNLAVAVRSIHSAGHVVGDLNESNILVDKTNGFVTLIDTDSFQVADKNGRVYRCAVGKPEFTPPELQGRSFKDTDRSEEHDLFGTGVMIFYLLMEGVHPFSGVMKNCAVSVGRVDLHCIKNGIFPFQKNAQTTPPPSAPSFKNLHPDIQKAFIRCFVTGHKKPDYRPSAEEWVNILSTAENSLKECMHDLDHIYSDHLKSCPWCEALQPGGVAFSGSGDQKRFKKPPSPKKGKRPKTPPPPPAKDVAKPLPILMLQWIIACCLGWGLSGAVVFGILKNEVISWFIFGTIGGIAQWFVLSNTVSKSWIIISSFPWLLFGTAKTSIDKGISALLPELQNILIKYNFNADILQFPYLSKAFGMGIIGLFGGIVHWFLLREKVKHAYFWIFACALGSAAGVMLSNMTFATYQYGILDFLGAATNRNMNRGIYWATYGAGYAVITGITLWRLMRNPKS
jgi:serine/threonine protein kinase